MNSNYEHAFKQFVMQLFQSADADYKAIAEEEEELYLMPDTEEKLLLLVPEQHRERAQEYLIDINTAARFRLETYYSHGLHDGARLLQHLLLD